MSLPYACDVDRCDTLGALSPTGWTSVAAVAERTGLSTRAASMALLRAWRAGLAERRRRARSYQYRLTTAGEGRLAHLRRLDAEQARDAAAERQRLEQERSGQDAAWEDGYRLGYREGRSGRPSRVSPEGPPQLPPPPFLWPSER